MRERQNKQPSLVSHTHHSLTHTLQTLKEESSVLADKLAAESTRASELQQELDTAQASVQALQQEKQEVS